MADHSAIEWTEATWNPTTGCTKISPGCAHCYAERMARRLQAAGQPNYANGFRLTVHETMLALPARWKSPRRVFVNSMSDLFHEDVPDAFIRKVFSAMKRAPWHTYQILTKRSERLRDHSPNLTWGEQVWMGVSLESREYQYRVDHLRETDAYMKFLSVEPMLGPIPGLNLKGIDWVIVGGESGPGARPVRPEWVTDIRDQCLAAGVSFFFKQWGGVNKKKAGRLLEGRTWDHIPERL
jgi:protein gp37